MSDRNSEINKKLSCGVLVIDDNGRLLMQHVKGKEEGSGHWDIPKGGQAAWESPEQTAIRELAEETGVIASEDDLIDVGVYEYNRFKDIYLYVLRVKEVDTRNLTINETKEDRSYGYVDDYRMIPWNSSSELMCYSLQTLFLDRMKKEVDILVDRYNAKNTGIEISYINDK